MKLAISWPGVVLAAVFVAGGVTASVLGQTELGMLLVGAAIGIVAPSPLRFER